VIVDIDVSYDGRIESVEFSRLKTARGSRQRLLDGPGHGSTNALEEILDATA
jgi:hypothetical protein